MEEKNKAINRIDNITDSILNQFNLIEKEINLKLDDYPSVSALHDGLKERMNELKSLIKSGDINPLFNLNINISDNHKPIDRPVKIIFFPFAGNPPHWGHLSSALDAFIQYKADKVIFVSNGNDPRKTHLLDVNIRYDLIHDAISLFNPFIEFGDLAKENFPDESLPLLGEYSLFRFFSLNPKSHIEAYYFAGSDHLNRTIIKNNVKEKDTIGLLEDNVSQKIFNFDSNYHEVIALINARDKVEYNEKIVKIIDPTIKIKRLNPTFSFSSTELRDALTREDSKKALFFLIYSNLIKIKKNGWYK